MKIIVSSDDGKCVVEVETGDIDLAGHTMNRTILNYRFKQATNAVYKYEDEKARQPAER